MKQQHATNGKHIILDLWNVEKEKIDDIKFLKKVLIRAIDLSGATLVKIIHKKFDPSGCTLLALLEESHMSIHTYPEENFCSIDFYTCGDANPDNGISYILSMLNPDKYYKKRLTRGEGEIAEY